MFPSQPAQTSPPSPGLVVEAVTPGSLAEQAGIAPGDRLVRYAGRLLCSPAHLQALEENTFSDRPLLLEIERRGQAWETEVAAGKMGVSVRPEMSEAMLTLYEQARQDQQAGRVNEAAQQLGQAQHLAAVSGDTVLSLYLCVEAGVLYEQVRAWEQALEVYEEGSQAGDSSEELASLVQVQLSSGGCYEKVQDFSSAESCYKQASELAERGSYRMWQARCLHHLGTVAFDRGDLSLAQDYCNRALVIKENLAPGSLEVAMSLGNLGNVALRRGDLALAQEYYNHALAIRENLAPGSLEVARSLNSLGIVAAGRGDLSLAQDYCNRALVIKENLAPGSLEVARSLDNLGNIALDRGDLSLAQDYYNRALTISENLAPGSLEVARSLNNLGIVAFDRGDLSLAQDYYNRVLAIFENLAPGSLEVAMSLGNLGNVALRRGDLALAQEYYNHALAIFENLAPGSLEVAMILGDLGYAASDRGDLSLAQDYCNRALAIFENLAPGSLDHAWSLEQMGKVHLKRHLPQQALPYLQQALDIVEKQRAQIAATEARALLLARHADKFFGLVQACLALKKPQNAFATLERARARSLLELLAERQADFASEAAPELLQQQQELDRQRAQAYTALAQLSLSDQEEIGTLHATLHTLEHRQQELTVQIRAASPRYAALQYPQPLDLTGAQAALEAGTLLLSYLVGEEKSYLFAVTSKTLACYELPVGQKALQEKVQAFRQALDIRLLEYSLEEAVEQAHVLYDLLLSPAQAAIDQARRLLVCPDAGLHSLPFAALVVKTGKKPVYLAARKPLHTTFSMTVYAQTRQARQQELASRPSPTLQQPEPASVSTPAKAGAALDKLGRAVSAVWEHGKRLVAIGDPLYALGQAGGPAPALSGGRSGKRARSKQSARPDSNKELAGMRSRGLTLEPLPYSRQEVEAIASLFGEQAQLYLGQDATKTAVRQASGDADILHFACHGFLDAQMPLSSGLILSLPEALGKQATEEDNGLLQAWEVLSSLRLKAELVVLSACQTGLGAQVQGEGLIGLTRAFTYAGAKSVVVSLWEVNDASTSHFMHAFYGGLQAGRSKTEALQGAMQALAVHPDWQHPFFWSGFSLVGDWS